MDTVSTEGRRPNEPPSLACPKPNIPDTGNGRGPAKVTPPYNPGTGTSARRTRRHSHETAPRDRHLRVDLAGFGFRITGESWQLVNQVHAQILGAPQSTGSRERMNARARGAKLKAEGDGRFGREREAGGASSFSSRTNHPLGVPLVNEHSEHNISHHQPSIDTNSPAPDWPAYQLHRLVWSEWTGRLPSHLSHQPLTTVHNSKSG